MPWPDAKLCSFQRGACRTGPQEIATCRVTSTSSGLCHHEHGGLRLQLRRGPCFPSSVSASRPNLRFSERYGVRYLRQHHPHRLHHRLTAGHSLPIATVAGSCSSCRCFGVFVPTYGLLLSPTSTNWQYLVIGPFVVWRAAHSIGIALHFRLVRVPSAGTAMEYSAPATPVLRSPTWSRR